MVRDFVDRVFDGAAGIAAPAPRQGSPAVKDERATIRRIIEEMEP